ncbi:MAG: 4-hydroxybenzoate solanesyltransferase [Verrucomicrobia subdivision 3 bacterium]|nr:4-hydroxybenzoate solanesyltransferase [Limisphaerales bacterium]MCS1414676.1 4-hydroxybenzoate solanesyltransferase [Limisphaerales bacterium]
MLTALTTTLRNWAEMTKFSHTIFVLPFAIASMVVAAKSERGWPGWRLFSLIILAMVTARTCAMTFNRIADRRFDAMNPRTKNRHLVTGKVSLSSAVTLLSLSAAGFLVTCWFINPICFALSPIALVLVCFYSITKRFTDFTHVYLGVALGLAPLGAWLAVEGSLTLAPVILSLAVVFWLIGFDIIYATQDYDFDRTHEIHSIIVRWGIKNALQAAFISHLIMLLLLVLFGLILSFRFAYFIGLAVIVISLLFEHWLARKRSLKWINFAFFRLNALISIVFLVITVVEVVFPMFRIRA